MIYYTSDLHIGHKNILKFCPNRPWKTVEEMNEGLIKNWNDTVIDSDHIYVLGDSSFSRTEFIELFKRLRGFKHIIIGNHDPVNIQKTHINKRVFFHPLIHTVKDEGRKVVLCHYPIYEWKGFFNNIPHFHGHTHGTIGMQFRENAFDVGVDVQGFKPRTYDEIVGDRIIDVRDQGLKIGGN